jgi:hypothetical protein
MRGLIAYAGSDRAVARLGVALKIQGRPPKLSEKLGPYSESRALHLFRQGHDTVAIAWFLACTPAAAANGLANARERERGQ